MSIRPPRVTKRQRKRAELRERVLAQCPLLLETSDFHERKETFMSNVTQNALKKIPELQAPELIKVRIDRIVSCRVQPGFRHKDSKRLDALAADIAKGIWDPPSVVSHPRKPGWYIAGDGNRRLAAAKKLGITEVVLAVYRDIAPDDLFARLNRDTQPVDGRSWLAGFAQKPDSERERYLKTEVPPTPRINIERMFKVFGKDRTVELGLMEGGVAPSVAKRALVAATVFARFKLDYQPPLKKIGEWAIACRGAEALHQLTKSPPPGFVRKLAVRIKHMTPFPVNEWFARTKNGDD